MVALMLVDLPSVVLSMVEYGLVGIGTIVHVVYDVVAKCGVRSA